MNPHQHKAAPLFIPDMYVHEAPSPDHWIYSEAVHYYDGPSNRVRLQIYTRKGPINICSAKACFDHLGIHRRNTLTQDMCNALWRAFLDKRRALTYFETASVLSVLKFSKALTK